MTRTFTSAGSVQAGPPSPGAICPDHPDGPCGPGMAIRSHGARGERPCVGGGHSQAMFAGQQWDQSVLWFAPSDVSDGPGPAPASRRTRSTTTPSPGPAPAAMHSSSWSRNCNCRPPGARGGRTARTPMCSPRRLERLRRRAGRRPRTACESREVPRHWREVSSPPRPPAPLGSRPAGDC